MGTDVLAFEPCGGGLTVNLAVTQTTGNTALTALGDGRNIRFYNKGPDIVYLRFGTSSSITATTASGMPLAAGAIEVLSCGPALKTPVTVLVVSVTVTVGVSSSLTVKSTNVGVSVSPTPFNMAYTPCPEVEYIVADLLEPESVIAAT